MAKSKDLTGQRPTDERALSLSKGLSGDGASTGSADVALRFEMPFPVTAPRLINPGLGLASMVGRLGHNAAYTMDVTLLDATDHRLIRSGVVLAHRVVGEFGEWYLAAPVWAPLLPAERVEPMGSGDLPDALAGLVRPFRRRATLGPVAALTCVRGEFEFRDEQARTRALLRDDKVTVRRAGVTTARYREVTLTPFGGGLTRDQLRWLCDALTDAGGTLQAEFPPLVTRLGTPATGLTDFPRTVSPTVDLPFGTFVARWLAVRLRALVAADLRLTEFDGRSTANHSDRGAAAVLFAEASRLRDEIEALSGVLDADWISDLDDELDWLIKPNPELSELAVAIATSNSDNSGLGADTLRTRLRGERYLAALGHLVTAVRAPKVGDLSNLAAADVIATVIDDARDVARAAVSGLAAESDLAEADQAEWDRVGETLAAYHRALCLIEIAGSTGDSGGSAGERRRLNRARQSFAVAADRARGLEQIGQQGPAAEPAQAFELGRRYEQQRTQLAADRAAFLRRWTKLTKKLEN